MAYNVLGIHPGHNGSACLISDGELVYYLEEERLSRLKRDGNPFRAMIDICSKYKVDELVIGGTTDSNESNKLPWTSENPYKALVRKYNPNVKVTWLNHQHHLLHASCAFYNSGFDKAAILIIDGAGSLKQYSLKSSDGIEDRISGYECESIWTAEYPGNFKTVYKSYGKNDHLRTEINGKYFDNAVTIAKAYEAVTLFLGWNALEGGKTMGLAPYGKRNPKIPPLFKNGRGNRDIFMPFYPSNSLIDNINIPIFRRTREPDVFHRNQNELLDIEADLAWQIQNDTQEEVAKLIEKTINLTGLNKICIAGGYGLNCVTNYWIKKRFPNVEIYHEAISHDGGTAIGAAKSVYHDRKNDFEKRKQTSIYLGPKYSNKIIENSIKIYNNMFNVYDIQPENVAKLISENNIVTIFQGRSEAGPRALGNRSILYNPTDPNGKDYVNKVKNREWFRPFAGTVLLEKANEWFDMAGLEESPFMMYAMDVWPDKQETIKAITHVDGTCRIQTVTEEQNPHYYKLIQEFEKITGVPILFNTSFNLAGDPLVETIEDALETMLKSEMKYMYVPELGYLLEKK
jgi:carbamoyltransferase